MAVADLEEGAGGVHGDEQRRPGDERLVVEIAGVDPRRVAADAPGGRRRRDAHATEERLERHLDAGREGRDQPPTVQRDDAGLARMAILRKESATAVVSVRNREVDRKDSNFEHVAGRGTVDEHRTCQNVGAWSSILDLGNDLPESRLDLIGRHAGALESIGHIRQQCVDVDDVPRGDAKDRLRGGVVVTVGDSLGRRRQAMGPTRRRLGCPHDGGSGEEECPAQRLAWVL